MVHPTPSPSHPSLRFQGFLCSSPIWWRGWWLVEFHLYLVWWWGIIQSVNGTTSLLCWVECGSCIVLCICIVSQECRRVIEQKVATSSCGTILCLSDEACIFIWKNKALDLLPSHSCAIPPAAELTGQSSFVIHGLWPFPTPCHETLFLILQVENFRNNFLPDPDNDLLLLNLNIPQQYGHISESCWRWCT